VSQPEKRLEIPFKITATRAWSVYIGRGLAGRLGDFIDLKAYTGLVLLTDKNTDRLYGEPVAAVLAQTGRKTEALEELEAALKPGQAFEESAQAQALLKTLKP